MNGRSFGGRSSWGGGSGKRGTTRSAAGGPSGRRAGATEPQTSGPHTAEARAEAREAKETRQAEQAARRAKERDDELAADPEAVARAICLRLLTGQPKTRAQLAEALAKREVPAEAAEAVLSRFGEVGLIDDAAFAHAWVESRQRGRGLGRSVLASELRRRGVAQETIQEAVDLIDPDDEEAAARELVARRLSSTRRLAPEVRVRRLVGMLARRGHPQGLAVRVVREALAADGTASEALSEDAWSAED